METTSPWRPYFTTIKALQFNEEFPTVPMENFQSHCTLDFDLTPLQNVAEELHCPERISRESLTSEMFFQFLLKQVPELIVLGERLSNVQLTNS